MCAFVFGRTPEKKPDSNRGFQELVGKVNDEYNGNGFKSPPPTQKEQRQEQQPVEEEEQEQQQEEEKEAAVQAESEPQADVTA